MVIIWYLRDISIFVSRKSITDTITLVKIGIVYIIQFNTKIDYTNLIFVRIFDHSQIEVSNKQIIWWFWLKSNQKQGFDYNISNYLSKYFYIILTLYLLSRKMTIL